MLIVLSTPGPTAAQSPICAASWFPCPISGMYCCPVPQTLLFPTPHPVWDPHWCPSLSRFPTHAAVGSPDWSTLMLLPEPQPNPSECCCPIPCPIPDPSYWPLTYTHHLAADSSSSSGNSSCHSSPSPRLRSGLVFLYDEMKGKKLGLDLSKYSEIKPARDDYSELQGESSLFKPWF